MDVTLLVLVIAAVALLVILVVRSWPRRTQGSDQSTMLMQQQMDALRGEMSQGLKNTADTLGTSLKNTQDVLYHSLKITTETVNQQLNVVTSQLSSVTQQLQNNTGQMGSRLDNAARVIQDVQNKLGELGKATQEIKELGQSVSKLEEMLKAPKLRGGLGELLLEDLLKQVLPSNAYDMQYRFKNGQTVDAIIRTAGGMVPVDSKFPLENFQKMLESKSDQEKRTALRTFRSDVKKHIDAVSEKYILPDESAPEENGLYNYAMKKRVVPVSPNSFYAHLRVIALGLKGLQIERSAKEILQNLDRLGSELQKFSDLFETLGTQLTNAKNNFDKADKQLSGLTEKFKSIQSIPDSGGGGQLDAFKGAD